MWFYVQMALQLLTVSLTAAICFSVAHSSLHMQSLIRKPRGSQGKIRISPCLRDGATG
jgi:hypothetical protein